MSKPAKKVAGSLALRRYRLDSELSSGGMGVLYRATHVRTGREVALKYLLDGDHDQRFSIEARAAAELKHPNVVEVIDMDEDEDGAMCLVLELLHGESLASLLTARKALTPTECFTWLLPIMGALAVAHGRGILHRDLKPENIFLATAADGGIVPKLLDFGVAKLAAEPGLTRTGAVVGTPSYMSPEQATGDAELLPTSDVWAMGVIWFQCLTGRLPFEHPTAMGTMLKIVNGRAPRVGDVSPEVPKTLGWVIDRALQCQAGSRHPSMQAFARALLAAGLRDQLTLPSAPDPIGLPDWSRWLTDEQSVASTGELDRVESSDPTPQRDALVITSDAVAAPTVGREASRTPAETPHAMPRRKTRWLTALALAALLALGVSFAVRQQVPAEAPTAPPAARSPATSPTPRPNRPSTAPRGVSGMLEEGEF